MFLALALALYVWLQKGLWVVDESNYKECVLAVLVTSCEGREETMHTRKSSRNHVQEEITRERNTDTELSVCVCVSGGERERERDKN